MVDCVEHGAPGHLAAVYFLATLRGSSRVPVLLLVWSRTPTRMKSWPGGRSICWVKRMGSLLASCCW